MFNTIWTYSRYFLGCPWLYSTGAGGNNARKVCIRGICDESTYIKDVLTCHGNAYIESIYGKDVYTKVVCIKVSCIDSIYINDFGVIKYLKIYLQSFQISGVRLLGTVLGIKLRVN